MTLNDILQQGEQAFLKADLYFGHGTDNAWDEAVWLTFFALDLPLDSDRSMLTKALSSTDVTRIQQLFQRRIEEKIPAAYITQQAWFCGLPFYVDQRVLVPRSPIAELILQGFQPWIGNHKVQRLLDLCTGSGCIAIACTYAFDEAQVDASDISTDALAVARMNNQQHGDNVRLFQSDLFTALPKQKYDIIVSNPPYVDAQDMATLPAEYCAEPTELALAAGHDGLQIVDRILSDAVDYLTEQGILVIEVGNSAPALEAKYPQLACTWLSFENGGDGVLLVTHAALKELEQQNF